MTKEKDNSWGNLREWLVSLLRVGKLEANLIGPSMIGGMNISQGGCYQTPNLALNMQGRRKNELQWLKETTSFAAKLQTKGTLEEPKRGSWAGFREGRVFDLKF